MLSQPLVKESATFVYKCRRCGAIHRGATGSLETAEAALAQVVVTHKAFSVIGAIILESETHICEDKNVGVTDLIGLEYNYKRI